MSIGKNIRKARQEADMTQEQLAELLNISVSAVSQWESDKTTPDISMIPALCNVFQMTSDKLLDIELEKNEEEIEAVRAEASKFSSKGKGLEAEKILLEGLRRFPNSYGMMYDLMYITYVESFQEKYEEPVRKQYLDRAINYAEKIIQDSKDDFLRSGAKQIRCYIHADAGEHDKAIAIAKTMDNLSCCQESMLTAASKGTERYQRGQEYGDFYNAEDEYNADWTLMVMEKKHFDFLRENARFQEIKRSLQEYAGGWGSWSGREN